MANTPEDLSYTKDHEWVRVKGEEATVGITDHAQQQLGDIVYVELIGYVVTGPRKSAPDRIAAAHVVDPV